MIPESKTGAHHPAGRERIYFVIGRHGCGGRRLEFVAEAGRAISSSVPPFVLTMNHANETVASCGSCARSGAESHLDIRG